MASTLELIHRLSRAKVEFVIIGGVACTVYGSQLTTEDLDICAPMELENLQKIVGCLQDAKPKFRMRPDLPVVTTDNHNLRGMKNLYLQSDVGQLDVLGEVPGIGDYSVASKDAVVMDFEGSPCKVMQIDKLIQAKRTAGRPRDHIAIAHMEVFRKRLQGGPPPSMPGSIKTPDSDQRPDPRA
jgi:hypothetical protein